MVGLGNPGPDYKLTRHNVGFWFVEYWAEIHGLPFRKAWFRPYSFCKLAIGGDLLVLVKPLTYMNRSGLVFETLLRRFGTDIGDILVVFDQMDLPPGRLRLKPRGSSAGHNGLKSIEAALRSDDYSRLAIGIGRSTTGQSVVDHVLGVPNDDDSAAIRSSLVRGVSLADKLWLRGWEPLIREINQSNSSTV